MNHLWHSKTHVHDITLSPYSSSNSWNFLSEFFFFSFPQEIYALLNFYPSRESGTATQHGHTQTKLGGKLTDRETSPILFDLRRFKVDLLYSLPHSYKLKSQCSPGITCIARGPRALFHIQETPPQHITGSSVTLLLLSHGSLMRFPLYIPRCCLDLLLKPRGGNGMRWVSAAHLVARKV
jgi:hypothetical protein